MEEQLRGPISVCVGNEAHEPQAHFWSLLVLTKELELDMVLSPYFCFLTVKDSFIFLVGFHVIND